MSTVSNSLSPGELNMSATGSGRVKVSLGPGRSLMDWIRLTHANPNLSGVNGRFLEVTYEELLKHNKKDDAWICLKGRVYNVTPYMDYHPGGVDELLRGVGKDATDLFNQVHKWVNFESMLEKCLIGKIVGPAVQIRKCSQEHVWRFEQETLHWTNPCPQRNKVIRHQRQWHVHVAEVGIRMLWLSATVYLIVTQSFPASFPVPRIPFIKKLQRTDTTTSEDVPDINEETSPRPSVSYEWFQDDSTVTVSIQSKGDAVIEQDKVVADLSGKDLRIRVRLEKYFFIFHVELQENVYSSYNVQVKCKLKCLEVQLVKERNGVSWSSLGSFLANHNQIVPLKNAESYSRSCTLVNKDSITHDITLFTFSLPPGSFMWVPIGHHVTLEHDVKGMKISRSYTPVIPALKADEDVSDGKTVHLMIKIYPEGALTPVLKTLEIGDKLDMKDTEGDFELSTLQRCRNLVLLAAGTGFTPMVRLLHWALFVSNQMSVKLMTFNKTVRDIIWKDELDQLQEDHSRLHVEHVLSEPDDSWEGARGRVRSELVEPLLPEDFQQCGEEKSLLVCACGPLPFTKAALKCLEDLQCPASAVHAFLG